MVNEMKQNNETDFNFEVSDFIIDLSYQTQDLTVFAWDMMEDFRLNTWDKLAMTWSPRCLSFAVFQDNMSSIQFI